MRTSVANYIGKPNLGYAILALASANMQKQMTNLLEQLSSELPGVLWPMPPEQLHITLCEIIQPKDYSQDKETLYKLHQEQYETIPADVLSGLPKFEVTFDKIEVSPQAIIVRASDSSAFNAIRAHLVAQINLPAETRTPPDITHCSIARYMKEVDLERVQAVVARHNIRIREEISEFKLVKHTILPLQEYAVIKSYPLANN